MRKPRTAPSTEIVVPPESLPGLSWPALFGNERPVELEIGCGKGGFLLERALARPNVNFFAIEWANKYFRFAVDRMNRWGLANVRLCRTDAGPFLCAHCPRATLSVLHVYHPDPWPKKRHHRRRLIQQPFVEAAAACLVTGGVWAVQTDHAGYFEQIAGLLRGHAAFEEIRFDDPSLGLKDAPVATNFRIKYEREGRAIYQIAVRRVR